MYKTTLALFLTAFLVSCHQVHHYPTVTVSHDLSKVDVEKILEEISNWGRWGADDERGTLNLITPEKKLAAKALMLEGLAVSLSHSAIKGELEKGEFVHDVFATGSSEEEFSGCSDEFRVRYHGFTQTHVDALCHMMRKGEMYNGFKGSEVTREDGAKKLHVANMKEGIFTRGVLMDIARLKGEDFLGGSTDIYPEDLDAWEKKTGVRVGSGDAVLIRTGRWLRNAVQPKWDYSEFAGLHASCLPWLKARDVAVIGSDLALDVNPSHVEGLGFPVHYGAIYSMGMPILDNNDYEQLGEECARRGRWTFLLTVNPLVVEGGTGSPVNPIAYF